MTVHAWPKRTPAAPEPPRRIKTISAKRAAAHPELVKAGRTIASRPHDTERRKNPVQTSLSRKGAIPKKNESQRSRRQAKNAAYYKSAEWREKRKLTFERDGYRCTERIPLAIARSEWTGLILPAGIFDTRRESNGSYTTRCLAQGEVINGQQTGKGLVCEETSYGHRGVPGRIDTCKTRCRDCDRRRTPLERANHACGFSGRKSTIAGRKGLS